MNTSGDAAEQIVRLSLEGFEVAAKITGSGAKDIAVLLYTLLKDKQRTAGKTNLTNMLKSGKELKVFSVKQDEFQKFSQEAKRYGVLYSALINKKVKSSDGIVDIMVRAEDASKINRIVERFKLSSYDQATIRSEIERTRNEKIKNEISKAIKKEEQSLNPHLAKTEKSPLSKPFLKTQKVSDKGADIIDKPSVKKKLEEYKIQIEKNNKPKEKIITNNHIQPKKKKNKEKSL